MNHYNLEVIERWGETHAYQECREKTGAYTKGQWQQVNDGLKAIFSQFAQCKKNGFAPGSKEVQVLVEKLHQYITEHYYTCTKDILKGLGTMYVADERFKKNIDANGEGTAEFVAGAILTCFK